MSLAAPDGGADAGVTSGALATGTGRRAAFSAGVEHIGVLYSEASMAEALTWLNGAFARTQLSQSRLDRSGPMILLLLGAIVALARPLSRLAPRLDEPSTGAGLPWREAWPVLVVPAIATPLLLRVLPTHFLPVIVADYLAAHFATYGILTFICMTWMRRRMGQPRRPLRLSFPFAATTAAYVLYTLGMLGWAVDEFVTSFVAIPARIPLILALLVGTSAFFLGDEWFARGRGSARGLYLASKCAFLGSLALAVGLDFQRLFFLAIIIPVIVPLLLVYGLFSTWAYARTGNPLVAGVGNALAFAWAIGVTFPMLAS